MAHGRHMAWLKSITESLLENSKYEHILQKSRNNLRRLITGGHIG